MPLIKVGLWKTQFAYLFLNGYAFPPRSLTFNMINKCNLNCRNCWQFRPGGIFSSENALPSIPLSLEELSMIIDEVCFYRPAVTIWGGEPFLSPHTLPFAQYVKDKGLFLKIITNGTLIGSKAKQLTAMKLDAIMISLDGPREVHDQIRGVPGTYDKVILGIEELLKEKKRTNSLKPEIQINFTFNPLNQSFLLKFLESLGELSQELGEFSVSQLWFITNSLGRNHVELSKRLFGKEPVGWQGLIQNLNDINIDSIDKEINDFIRIKAGFKKVLLPPLTKPLLQTYYQEPQHNLGYTRCLIPWKTADIMYNGDVSPCSDRPFYVAGNVRNKRFMTIWNGAQFRVYRNHLRRLKLFPICTRCCLLFDQ